MQQSHISGINIKKIKVTYGLLYDYSLLKQTYFRLGKYYHTHIYFLN